MASCNAAQIVKVKRSQDEIRRFTLPPTFPQLKKKVRQLFSIPKETRFSLTWQDESNDFITVSSDEELQTALTDLHSRSRDNNNNVTLTLFIKTQPTTTRAGCVNSDSINETEEDIKTRPSIKCTSSCLEVIEADVPLREHGSCSNRNATGEAECPQTTQPNSIAPISFLPSEPFPQLISQQLDRMRQMGFRNESGWMSALLLDNGGNIGNIMDIIEASMQREVAQRDSCSTASTEGSEGLPSRNPHQEQEPGDDRSSTPTPMVNCHGDDDGAGGSPRRSSVASRRHAEALANMEAMGFRNPDGCLGVLLQEHDCDINQVVEIIEASILRDAQYSMAMDQGWT